MPLRDPHRISKSVGAEFEVARLLHLLGRFTLLAAEHLMHVLILERPVDRVWPLMPAMNFPPFL
jgi:hypothetical protein